MTKIAFRGIAIFCVLLVATSLLFDLQGTEFGRVNFWDKHNVFLLIFLAIFPRLTLLFSSIATGGFLWWMGFIFCPRILIAILATVSYFHTNPVLVVISWLIALGGEVFEKWGIGSSRFHVHYHRNPKSPYHPPEDDSSHHVPFSKDDAIEAEFTKK